MNAYIEIAHLLICHTQWTYGMGELGKVRVRSKILWYVLKKNSKIEKGMTKSIQQKKTTTKNLPRTMMHYLTCWLHHPWVPLSATMSCFCRWVGNETLHNTSEGRIYMAGQSTRLKLSHDAAAVADIISDLELRKFNYLQKAYQFTSDPFFLF